MNAIHYKSKYCIFKVMNPFYLLVNGTTGEFSSLTVAERKNIAEIWMDKARGK